MHVLLIHQQPVQLMKLLYQAFAQLPNKLESGLKLLADSCHNGAERWNRQLEQRDKTDNWSREMEQTWSTNAAKMQQTWSIQGGGLQQRWSRDGTDIDSRWSRNAAEMEQRWSRNAAEMQQKCSRHTAYMEEEFSRDEAERWSKMEQRLQEMEQRDGTS